MNNRKKNIYFNMWIIVGGLVLLTVASLSRVSTDAYISKTMKQVKEQLHDKNSIVKDIALAFKGNPSIHAILISNIHQTQIYGSIYNQYSINQNMYKNIITSFYSSSLSSEFINQFNVIGYKMIMLDRSILFLCSNRNILQGQLFSVQNIGILFLFAIYIIIGYFLIFSHKLDYKRNLPVDNTVRQKLVTPISTKNTQNIMLSQDSLESICINQLVSLYNLEGQIKFVINLITRKLPCDKVSFFTWEDIQWKHYIEKIGNLTIQGSTNQMIPVCVQEFNPYKKDLFLSKEEYSGVVLLKKNDVIIGSLYVQLKGKNTFTKSMIAKLEHIASTVSTHLVQQKLFDQATIDQDTQFYTYPYFHIILSEKLKSQTHFTALAIHIHNIHLSSKRNIKNWAYQLHKNLYATFRLNNKTHDQDQIQYSIYRIAIDKFILLFNLKGIEAEHIMSFFKEMIKVSVEHKKNKGVSPMVISGDLVNPRKLDDLQTYMERVDRYFQSVTLQREVPYPPEHNISV